ncbi:hypothetical protein COR50_10325 [Chitinophaga caeni]|uniref:DUF1493 domain-containing protein n=2 Tax=Chitinophaga caeni TaxID=2029983 RepID=A0A291QUD8_9BACT|nr:hypothetical protein COR50_10325 [Chitinophaga caeni]
MRYRFLMPQVLWKDKKMNQEAFQDLVAFIHEQSRSYEVPITLDTSIENDLGVTGDDGEALILAFSKRYNVNIDNFYITKYFYPEPFMSKIPGRIAVLNVGHLLKAINVGRLDDEVIK